MATGDARVSGAMLVNHRRAMEDLVGSEVMSRAMASLTERERTEYTTLTALSWIPVEIAEAAVVAVAREAGRDLLPFHADVTRLNLQRTFTTIWRILLRVTTDSGLISRTPVLYSKTFNLGELSSKVVSPGLAKVTVRGWSTISAIQVEGLRVGVETVLEIAGRRDVRVVSKRHPEGADFSATWR